MGALWPAGYAYDIGALSRKRKVEKDLHSTVVG